MANNKDLGQYKWRIILPSNPGLLGSLLPGGLVGIIGTGNGVSEFRVVLPGHLLIQVYVKVRIPQ